MTKENTNANKSALLSFLENAAAIFTSWAQVQSITVNGLSRDLAYAGINGEIKSGDTPAAVKVEVAEPNVLPYETTRDMFTASAISGFEAAALVTARGNVWRLIKSRHENGHVTAEDANAALDTLGYAADLRPSTVTSVSAEIYSGTAFTRVDFTLDGQHSESSIRASLLAVADQPGGTVKVQRAFPDAKGMPEPIRSLRVYGQLTWPEYSAS